MNKAGIRYQRAERTFKEMIKDIVLARHEKGWSQKELAERAGVSLATVQRIERGDASVKVGTLFMVMGALGILKRMEMAASSYRYKEERDARYLEVAERRVKKR